MKSMAKKIRTRVTVHILIDTDDAKIAGSAVNQLLTVRGMDAKYSLVHFWQFAKTSDSHALVQVETEEPFDFLGRDNSWTGEG